MSYNATIHVDPSSVIGRVHSHLYGANLKHIGQTIYGGVWAEMLRGRKFAGHDRMYLGLSEGLNHQNPDYGIVEPWTAVNPDGDAVLFVHDNTTFYTGQRSQRITIRQDDGQQHGIRQAGLHLQAGRDYAVRLVLGGEGQAVRVQLGAAEWRIPQVEADWTTYATTLKPEQTETDGIFSMTFAGVGNLWIGCASLMPSDNVGGFRTDVIAAIQEWIPTFLRWPGGNFVSAYHWELGIGERDRRPSYYDPVWRTWETNDVGTDEFVDLFRLVGSEPILTVNMGTGTVDEAAAWVEYCNGKASSIYGGQRAANGFSEPYQLKTWFVGNEQFGNWQVGHCDAETYARRYLAFARAMRAADSDVHLIGVGVPIDLYGHWNELVLGIAGRQMDALSVHYYSIRTELAEKPPASDTLYLPKMGAAHEVALMLDRTLAIMDEHSGTPLPLAFDEWNTYWSGKWPDYFEDYDMADALYVGGLMHACLRRCDRIIMSAIYNLINCMGSYRVTPTQVWKTPSTLVLELLTHQRGAVGVQCDVETPSMPTTGAGNLPAFDAVARLDAAATYDAETDSLYLSVVNRDPEQAATVILTGVERAGRAVVYRVAGAGPLARNDAYQPDAVMIETTEWAAGADNLTIPAHSFTMVVIRHGVELRG
jgi:alpha-N-arabinofuranosidase